MFHQGGDAVAIAIPIGITRKTHSIRTPRSASGRRAAPPRSGLILIGRTRPPHQRPSAAVSTRGPRLDIVIPGAGQFCAAGGHQHHTPTLIR